MRREAFKFWDLVRLIVETLRYVELQGHDGFGSTYIYRYIYLYTYTYTYIYTYIFSMAYSLQIWLHATLLQGSWHFDLLHSQPNTTSNCKFKMSYPSLRVYIYIYIYIHIYDIYTYIHAYDARLLFAIRLPTAWLRSKADFDRFCSSISSNCKIKIIFLYICITNEKIFIIWDLSQSISYWYQISKTYI